ncbi:hypothetical protein WJX72_007033 [[Myrmecia] bisecta]|uniref:F-box domain-containing protein n=1 Tax=[Myrmecia] bisecta TaxID=41462 RepID=A0AAW1PQ79_9CHLO
MLTLLDLPEECLLQTLSTLAVQDVLALACTCKQFARVTHDDVLWKELAFAKWGQQVLELRQQPAEESEGGWSAYCRHRMSFISHKPSPLALVQEQYADPWQHLVCCLLCSRTSGGQIIRDTISSFLRLYPTPSAVLCTPNQELETTLNPVGLQEVRCKAVQSMSHAFLAENWQDPSEFWGCGRFAADSWRIFCRGDKAARVEDATLQRYLRWLKSGKDPQPARKPAQKRKARSTLPQMAKSPASTRQLRSRRQR